MWNNRPDKQRKGLTINQIQKNLARLLILTMTIWIQTFQNLLYSENRSNQPGSVLCQVLEEDEDTTKFLCVVNL